MTVVALFAGTRADLNPLLAVIEGLHESDAFDMMLLIGPGHTKESVAADLRAAEFASLPRIVEVAPRIDVVDGVTEAQVGASLVAATCGALVGVEVLVVLGDRWELLFVVPAAVLLGIRVVHLHGGEVTLGAVDDRIRHAVTKLADQHCVASIDAAERVGSMGEDPARIHVTGAPGLDRLSGVEPFSDEEFEAEFGHALIRPLALFTYHPPTAVTADPKTLRSWSQDALDVAVAECGIVVATHPGLDTGHSEIRSVLDGTAERAASVIVRPSLGHLYPRMLATADVMIGNSSSGIVEAASFALPVIDIGDRQRGRLRGANVVSVAEGADGVRVGVREVLATDFRSGLSDLSNPYGNGHATKAILEVIDQAAATVLAKKFVDPVERTPQP